MPRNLQQPRKARTWPSTCITPGVLSPASSDSVYPLTAACASFRIIPFVAADAVVNRYPDELSAESLSSRFGLTAADPPAQQDTRAPPGNHPRTAR